MVSDHGPANIINHTVLVIDESDSMHRHAREVVKVADNHITWLAERSKQLNQETRITVYLFSSRGTPRCIIYDMDVLRVPSLKDRYRPRGMTALIDATSLAITDLRLTPEKYGDHSFLIYVITDGMENQSVHTPEHLSALIKSLPEHWTLGVFVPDQRGVFSAKTYGFPAGNISTWDTSDNAGFTEVGETIRKTTEQYMQGRAKGVRGTRSLFQVNADASTVTKTLTPLTDGSFYFLDVSIEPGMPSSISYATKKPAVRIDDFIQHKTGSPYNPGKFLYEFTKPEKIQGDKLVAVEVKGKVYTGAAARSVLQLPNYEVRVRPGDHKDCTIFVQSTSFNRKLPEGTRVLALR